MLCLSCCPLLACADIKPGQGMYFSPATNKYTAVNCASDNYGVSNTTYGLAAYPCRDCPAGMQTMATAPSSNYKSDNGYTSPAACVTKAGFGYNGRVATQCPVGSYNSAGNYGTCTQCPAGYTTNANATEQVAQSDCKVAAGYGYYNGAVIPCPVGECHVLTATADISVCDLAGSKFCSWLAPAPSSTRQQSATTCFSVSVLQSLGSS